MDYEIFKKLYLNAEHQYIWKEDIINTYIPVIERAINETITWFDSADQKISSTDIGSAIIASEKHQEKYYAIYVKRRITGNIGSIFSIFKENYNIAAKGYDSRLGIPIPPAELDEFIAFFERLGKSKSDAETLWNNIQSYKRKIFTFRTLANKSINRQRRVPPKLRMKVLSRDGFRCVFCGCTGEKTSLHVDHIKPVAKGGSSKLDFLATLCEECNLGKGTQDIENILGGK